MSTPRALSPLRTPAYRWLFGSLVASVLGSGLVVVALFWQIVELGGGPGQVSLVLTATGLGMLATTLLGGALADRVPQKRILLVVELVNAVALGTAAGLAFTGVLHVWHLAAVALLTGLAAGVYYPAYSAVLPSLLPAEELLAANGIEGMLRPALMQAGGPALAAALVAAWSPAVALAGAALAALAAAGFVVGMPLTAVRREQVDDGSHPLRQVLVDVKDGFVYMARTPWLLATLLFASAMVLVMLGPFEVLGPFAIKDRAGGGPAEHAWVLAAFGIGGALGSLLMASLRLPRRYLTVMNVVWGLSCVPLVVFGTATSVWPMVVAGFVMGAGFQGATVIWGTLLQRRVPSHMLGRVSSLDFFVSLAFMPVSMALAGPVSELVGLEATFLVAGLAPPVLAVLAILLPRLDRDELAHPLDVVPEAVAAPGQVTEPSLCPRPPDGGRVQDAGMTALPDLAPADRYRLLAAQFTDLVRAVPEDRWDSPSPCPEWTARGVVGHVVGSQRGYAEGAGESLPPAPDAASDPVGAWTATRDGVQALLEDPARAQREVQGRTGTGSIEGTMGVFHCVDLVVHGWDLAQAAGLASTVPPDQLAWARGLVEQMADLARSPGGFGPEVDAPADADETTRTMAFLGRRPVPA